MALVNKIKLTPQQMAQIENAIAESERNAAIIEYVAMMADVELPDENTTEVNDAQPEIR